MGRSAVTRANAVVLALAAAATVAGGDAAAQDRRALSVAQLRSIGVESGDRRLEFGHIEGMAVDESRGVLFVIDRINARLSAFTREGRLVASAGRSGKGPGEFQAAGAVAAHGSTVYVLDYLNLRISTYALRGGSLTWVGDTRVPFNARDLCVLNGHLFLFGYHDGKIVHRFDLAGGRVLQSFGRPFLEGDAMLESMTALGYIHCDAASRSVLVAAISIPTVRRYSAAGQLLWETRIPGVVPPVITRVPAGVQYSQPRNRASSDVVVSVTAIPAGRVLVQFGDAPQGIRNLEDVVKVKSVVFDVRTGAVVSRLGDVPRIDFTSGRHAYSHANDPFPRVVVYTWR